MAVMENIEMEQKVTAGDNVVVEEQAPPVAEDKKQEEEDKVVRDRDIRIPMKPYVWITVFGSALAAGLGKYFLSWDWISAIQVFVIVGLLAYTSLVDLKLHMAPDWITYALLAVSVPSIVLAVCAKSYMDLVWMGAGAVFCFMLLIVSAVVSKGGIGGADVKIMTALGLYLGIQKSFIALLVGLLLAVLVNGIMIITKKAKKSDKFALVPYLSLGALYFLIF